MQVDIDVWHKLLLSQEILKKRNAERYAAFSMNPPTIGVKRSSGDKAAKHWGFVEFTTEKFIALQDCARERQSH